MSIPLISFIVPAYNVGGYLRTCLDSIYRMEMGGEEREVIVVDDGSTDNTAEILASYRTEHPDIVVVSQSNQGLGSARNAGIEVAKGRYICFVDSDDSLRPTVFPAELLANGIDIIGINVLHKDAKGALSPYKRYPYQYNKVYSPAQKFVKGRNLMPCAWAYLYRTAFLKESQQIFTPHLLCEDEDFILRVFAVAKTFMAVDLDFYIYTEREESITTTTDTAKQQQRLRDLITILWKYDSMAAADAEFRECSRYKLDYLTVDILRLLLKESYEPAFRKEIVSHLRAMGRFPLRWHWETKHMAFNLYTRIILRNCR